jgi:murein DD-endopeptidase MepM/ murein hydrolase activator NlpD
MRRDPLPAKHCYRRGAALSLLLVAACLALLLPVSASGQEAGQGAEPTEYSDPQFSFSLEYPSDWLLVAGRVVDPYTFVYEVRLLIPSLSQRAIIITVQPALGYDSMAWADQNLRAMDLDPQALLQEGRVKSIEIDQIPAMLVSSTHFPFLAYFTHGGYGFGMALQGDPHHPEGEQGDAREASAAETQAFMAVLSSFTFIAPPRPSIRPLPSGARLDDASPAMADVFRPPLDEARLLQDYDVHPSWWKGMSSCFATQRANTWHAGEDWAAPAGTPVRAVANGIASWYDPAYSTYPGRVLVLQHQLADGNMVYSMYAHLGSVSVYLGQMVARGEVIGTILDQGENSHLHWEMRTFADGSFLCGFAGGPGYTYPDHPTAYGYLNPSEFVAQHGQASLTNGDVLDELGLPEAPPAAGRQDATVIQPGQIHQAEIYWGLRGIDRVGVRPGACPANAEAVYLAGWHQGDLAEYQINFPSAYQAYRLTAVGIPDDPAPVQVDIYIDGQRVGQIIWNDANPRCNESQEGNSHRIELSGYQGVHALAFRFGNDSYRCQEAYGDACDRNFWFDYFYLEEMPHPPTGSSTPQRSSKLQGSVMAADGQPEADILVSAWRHDGGQFLTTRTDASGTYQFTSLDPDGKYNLTVNAYWVGTGGDCGAWELVDARRGAAVRNNVELTASGDGWHHEDFVLSAACPE